MSFKSLMRGLDQAGNYPDLYMYAHSGWTFRPEDIGFEAGWQQYHQERCSLRMLCEACHLKVTLEARMARPMLKYFGESESSGSEELLITQMKEVVLE